MLSIIIPSRSPEFLQKTIDDLIEHAEGEIEIIVVYDGIWPDPPLQNNNKVIVLHHGIPHNSIGMRESINRGVEISKGKYILKIDEHCSISQGYDRKLAEHCKDNWVVIARRGRLDAENWTRIKDGRPDIDYMSIDYPYQRPNDKTCGLHGAEWRRDGRKHLIVDDTPTMQGSFYYMTRKHWDTTIKALDTEHYGPFTQEAQEISMKTWLSGGRVVVNKNVRYLHMHKGNKGKGYGFSNRQYALHMQGTEKGRLYCIDHFLYTKEYKYDWDWFMRRFPDMPGWGDDWKERIEKDKPLAYHGAPSI